MLIKTLLVLFLFAPLTTALAMFSTSENLNIELQQAVDANCDGLNDQPYSFSFNEPSSISPQQCLMYKISIKNIFNKTLYPLTLEGKIPLHTQFKPDSLSVYKEGVLQQDLFVETIDTEHIRLELTTSSALKQLTVFYAVVIN